LETEANLQDDNDAVVKDDKVDDHVEDGFPFLFFSDYQELVPLSLISLVWRLLSRQTAYPWNHSIRPNSSTLPNIVSLEVVHGIILVSTSQRLLQINNIIMRQWFPDAKKRLPLLCLLLLLKLLSFIHLSILLLNHFISLFKILLELILFTNLR
jgi:hypothetical protein